MSERREGGGGGVDRGRRGGVGTVRGESDRGETERETERETDRQTDRQTETERERG